MKKMSHFAVAALVLAASVATAGTTTAEVGAKKIHGGGYKCASFEEELAKKSVPADDLLKYGVLASSAYADRNDADQMMNGGQGRVDNWKLLESQGYTPVDEAETKRLLAGSGLNVRTETVTADKSMGQTPSFAVTISGDEPDKLNARLFKNEKTGEIVIAFRGTAGAGDIRDDAKQASHLAPTPQQYKDAAKVLDAVLANTKASGEKIVCTGHSLGGGLVQYAMASNELGGRVKGYTYNSAGLNGLGTVNSFDATKAKDAAANITGIRSDGDPVSFVGYHLLGEKKMIEVSTEVAPDGEHSIKGLLINMAANMNAAGGDGKTASLAGKIASDADRSAAVRQKNAQLQRTAQKQAQNTALASATPASFGFPPSIGGYLQGQISTNPDVQKGFDDAFDKIRAGLDTVLPAQTAQDVADKLEELAKKGVIAAGNAADKAIQAQIDKLKKQIMDKMPGEASKAQMGKVLDELLKGIGSGNFSTLPTEIGNLGSTLAGDYASKLVDGLNLPDAEKAALKKTISDAVQAYINGTGVGGAISGNIEAYIYNKIQAQFGKDVADAWKKAYTTWQGGGNPWADIGSAAKKTIETWAFQKLEKVIDAQLNKLLADHPVLKEVFEALGINSGSITNALKNIWGVLTGPGDLATKFKQLANMAVTGLANMLKSLLKWGLGKLQAWLNGIVTKIGKIISNWVRDFLKNTLNLSQSLVDKAMKAVDAAIKAGTKVVVSLPSKLEKPIGNAIDAGAQKVLTIINGSGTGTPSTQPVKSSP